SGVRRRQVQLPSVYASQLDFIFPVCVSQIMTVPLVLKKLPAAKAKKRPSGEKSPSQKIRPFGLSPQNRSFPVATSQHCMNPQYVPHASSFPSGENPTHLTAPNDSGRPFGRAVFRMGATCSVFRSQP